MSGGRILAILASFAFAAPAIAADPFKLEKGDHICIIGNALAERMQHDGWLEAYLHARFPDHNLTIRNLGFSGDEVAGFTANPDFHKRLRSQDAGTADQWLSGNAPIPNPGAIADKSIVKANRFEKVGTNADVIFAFFGYNESWAGEAGLPQFRKDLEAFIKHTQSQKYNGKSAPRLVLFSPIAFENHKSPNLPTGELQNNNLAMYTKAMAEVAKANDVRFVDLFRAMQNLYVLYSGTGSFTINGLHLNDRGNRIVGGYIVLSDLFWQGVNEVDMPGRPLKQEQLQAQVEKIRPTIIEKNKLFYQRYRATDGYSTFGGRAWLKFVNGQTNYEVVQRELEVIDQMVLNRDKVIWAAAKGKDEKPDDSNLPAFIPVTTNKPGNGPNGKHLFLDGEDAIKSMKVGKGMKVSLFADEKMFPELANPVQMQFDPAGRLWVAVWPSYPHWKPGEPMNDKLLVFEDTNGDGKADKMTVFADKLHNPTGFEFYNGGVIVAQAPDLVFLKDTDGDGKADVRERILHGLDTADTHHTANSFVLDPGGALYFQEGTFHHSQVEDPYGPPKRVANGGVLRYEPRTQKFDVYVSYSFANPHGHVFDKWGQDIVIDGTTAEPYHGVLFGGHLDYPNKHAKPPLVYQRPDRPSGGMEILSSKHFPPEFDGNLLVTNCIGSQGIFRFKLTDAGSSLGGEQLESILMSTDPNFRPVDVKTGPDGAIWFLDWQNPIIGHMQHNLRDPSRDREHGRIYRVTYEGRKLSKSPNIAGESIEKLLELLKHPDDRVRYRAKVELGGRKTDDVMAALVKWTDRQRTAPDNGHPLLEALWVCQYHNALHEITLPGDPRNSIGLELLSRAIQSKDYHHRAAAIRVACYAKDDFPGALELLKKAAADEHPRVRLMAVWAASFFTVPEAAEVVFIAQEKPEDLYITFAIGETMKAIDPIVRKAIAEKKAIKFTTPSGTRFILKSVTTDELVKMDRSRDVHLELLFRPGVRDEFRLEALSGLAQADKKKQLQVLVEAIGSQDQSSTANESVAFDHIRILTAWPDKTELVVYRDEMKSLASSGKSSLTRQLGYVALIATDGSTEEAWKIGTKSVGALQDLVAAMPLVRDPAQRAALYPKVEALLAGLPADLAKTVGTGKVVKGRYVRVELPGKQRTLTLAEVEVFSDGKNVALHKKATQSSTAHGGLASRGVDGNTNGDFNKNGQTHTQEGTDDPWWEVDLGAEFPIEKVLVFNRDGTLGSRLANFTLRVLDAERRDVYQSLRNPAPAVKAEFAVGDSSPERIVRHSAMRALTSVRGKETEAFAVIAKFVPDKDERAFAIQSLLRIQPKDWPKESAKPLLAEVMKFIRSLPVADRTTPAALDAMQFGEALAGLLPPIEAKAARKELGDIGVRVIRVGTLTDQMLFDKDRLAVQAGKPVEFVFENSDLMPHNFVIVSPGSLEKVGNAAEAFGTQPGAAERSYVPAFEEPNTILLASKLLQPQQTQQLRFTPTAPGIYPYVCTYPGHWRRMHGALYVVADLDEYLADPTAYLAKNPLPVKDDLLKFNRPRTEWKLEELVGAVTEMEEHGGRNFANGRQMFTVATCVACHKFGGQGNDFGPDLTKLDAKTFTNSTDVLKHIIDPSLKIDDKYASFSLLLTNDKTFTGMIVEEKNGVVKLIENPVASAKPLEIKVEDIASRKKAMTSIMPKGLLDKLTKDEILDVLAYVRSGADPKHKLFQGHHH